MYIYGMWFCFLAGSGCGGTKQTLTAIETFQYLSSPSFPSQYPRYVYTQHRNGPILIDAISYKE